jgi:Holliday junction resolvasome RuvABC ATP-dependent DNA helicase subunit
MNPVPVSAPQQSDIKPSTNVQVAVADATDWPPKTNALGLVGQDAASIKVKNKSTMSVRLGRRFTDTLFVGPAGVGKSSFARAIAAEVLKEEPIFSSGSDAETPGDLISLLGSRGKIPPSKGRRKVGKCVVFIDEIHALSKKTSVFLLSALDDARLATEDGVEYDFNDVVFLGATTDKGCLTPAFLSRMDVIQLVPYSITELAGILYVHGKRVFGGYELSRDVCEEIAVRSRCNPRKAVRSLENDMLAHLLSLVPVELEMDAALREAGRLMTTASVSEYYMAQRVDLNGLDQTSINALKYLEKTESASREKLRKGLQITNETDFNEVMEYLERLKLVSTSTNGRSITNEGLKYLKSPTNLRRFM